MYKKNHFLIIMILLYFLFCNINICNAEEKTVSYIETSILKNEKEMELNVKINSTEDIYGFLGNINYDNKKLELKNCQSDNYDITVKDNMVLGESVVGYKDKILAKCIFNIKEEVSLEVISIIDITLSNGEKVLNNEDVSINFNNYTYEETSPSPDGGITNPQTGDKKYILMIFFIITIIIVITLSIVMIKIKKKYKIFIIPLIILLFPITILALEKNLNITKEQLSQIRNILLSKNSNEDSGKYDYDQDNKLTINDLIISLVDYKSPDISFDSESSIGTNEYKTEVTRIIKLESINKITDVVYCTTENEDCIPDKDYQYNNENEIKIKFGDSSKEQRICIKVKNELSLERTICDTESYKVDSVTPQITVKQQTISIGEDETYDPQNNITVTYGKSGGEVKCSGDIALGTNKIECSAIGKNGLTKDISFAVTVNKTLEKVYFIDTISMTNQANDAILIESNGKFGMIDTGFYDNYNKAQEAILHFLQDELKIETLEFVIITHGHKDHIGLYEGISNTIEIKNLYIKKSGYNAENLTKGYKTVIDVANKAGTKIIDVEEESTGFTFEDIEIKFYNREFVNNVEKEVAALDNANSIATLATVHGKKIYFAGDIGMYGDYGDNPDFDTEEKTAMQIGKVDVYKVAHHGYTIYQNSEKALSYIKPTYVIFTNATNYHYLTEEVIKRLKSVAPNYTESYYARMGTITMTIKKDGTLLFSQ